MFVIRSLIEKEILRLRLNFIEIEIYVRLGWLVKFVTSSYILSLSCLNKNIFIVENPINIFYLIEFLLKLSRNIVRDFSPGRMNSDKSIYVNIYLIRVVTFRQD